MTTTTAMTPDPVPAGRPVVLSGPSVRAVLAGTKTALRRVVRPRPPVEASEVHAWFRPDIPEGNKAREGLYYRMPKGLCFGGYCPLGGPGARLWVREAWQAVRARREHGRVTGAAGARPHGPCYGDPSRVVIWRADGDWPGAPEDWRPSSHMPPWAARLALEVTAVAVAPLTALSEADARAEGHRGRPGGTARDAFAAAWDGLHAHHGDGFATDPWVWVIAFQKATDGRGA
jgi:hypothetical protein